MLPPCDFTISCAIDKPNPTPDLLSRSVLIPEALPHLRSHTDTDSGWFETDIDILKIQLDKTRAGLIEKIEGRSQFCSPYCLKCTDPTYEQTKYLKTYEEGTVCHI